jgi:hypothetical protein
MNGIFGFTGHLKYITDISEKDSLYLEAPQIGRP